MNAIHTVIYFIYCVMNVDRIHEYWKMQRIQGQQCNVYRSCFELSD